MTKHFVAVLAAVVLLNVTGAVAQSSQTKTVRVADIKKHCQRLVLQFSGQNVADPNARKAAGEGEKNCRSYDPGTVILSLSQMQYALDLIGVTPHSR